MIQFDSQWLEKVWGSSGARGPYQKIDLEDRAGRIRSLFIQYLEMEAWKFTGDPPIDVRIKPIGAFPWVDYEWRGGNGGGMHHSMPLRNRTYPAVQRFSITLAPKFLRAKEEDLLRLLDFVPYGDAKSIRGLIETFAGPRFQRHPDRLAATPNPGIFLSDGLPLRRTSPARGRVYDLEAIRTKVEKEFLKFTTGVKIMWAESVSFNAAGRYVPEFRYVLINPALDYPDVPYVVVEHLVHHELLHDLITRKGRSAHHKAFKEAERQYPHYQEAKAWLRDNYYWMMGRAKRRQRQ